MARPEVSIVICHHTGSLLFPCLESVFKSENVTFEVIVLTSNRQLAIDGIKGCIVVHHEGLPAEKRNAGSRIARAKLLAFFDDDVTIDPLCLWHLKDTVKDSVAMAFGKLWNMEHRNRFDEAGGYLTWTGFIWSRAEQNIVDKGQFNTEDLIFAGKSASCMVRKAYFDMVGGFDEDFGILGEESDLAWRFWLNGRSVVFQPNATGYHAFGTSLKPKAKYYTGSRVHYNGCRNYATMLIKNLGMFNLVKILPIHLTIWFLAGNMMILTGRFRAGLHIYNGLYYVLKNFRIIWSKRSKVQAERKIADKELFKHIYRSCSIGYYLNRFKRYIVTGLHG